MLLNTEKDVRDCYLAGTVLALVLTNKPLDGYKFAQVYITLRAKYRPDWQEDGGFIHDEGQYEYNFDLKNVVDFDENYFNIIKENELIEYGDETDCKIKKIVRIYDEFSLKEVEYIER